MNERTIMVALVCTFVMLLCCWLVLDYFAWGGSL